MTGFGVTAPSPWDRGYRVTYLVLDVGVDPFQHPHTGVLIGQIRVHLGNRRAIPNSAPGQAGTLPGKPTNCPPGPATSSHRVLPGIPSGVLAQDPHRPQALLKSRPHLSLLPHSSPFAKPSISVPSQVSPTLSHPDPTHPLSGFRHPSACFQSRMQKHPPSPCQSAHIYTEGHGAVAHHGRIEQDESCHTSCPGT